MFKKYSALFLMLIVAGFISCKKADQVVPGSGIINFLAGEVFIIKDGNKVSAKAGDMITGGMSVETGAGSEAEIYFGENAIKVLEKTFFTVNDIVQNLTQNTDKTELYVQNGKLFSSVRKKLTKDSTYVVKTPTSIAGVRGTEFIVSEENGKGNIACSDGKVAVQDASKPESTAVEISAGQEVDVIPGADLKPRDISEMNRKNLEEIRKAFREMKADIRKQFEEQREVIRKAVIDQKQLNREAIDQQKAMNKENIESLKSENKEMINALKGDVSEQKEDSKKALEGVKPDVQSFKSEAEKPDVKSFKANVEKPKFEKPSIK